MPAYEDFLAKIRSLGDKQLDDFVKDKRIRTPEQLVAELQDSINYLTKEISDYDSQIPRSRKDKYATNLQEIVESKQSLERLRNKVIKLFNL